MMRLSIYIAVICVFSVLFVSCYYDSEEALYPTLNTSCDTTNVTFSGTIVPILNNNCYSCHSNTTASSSGNNIRLQNYSDVQARAAAIAGSISHTAPYAPMPKNGGNIKSCSIAQFDIWVRKGMINN
jgi:hypothetical protein